jgi:hypothetical protein
MNTVFYHIHALVIEPTRESLSDRGDYFWRPDCAENCLKKEYLCLSAIWIEKDVTGCQGVLREEVIIIPNEMLWQK